MTGVSLRIDITGQRFGFLEVLGDPLVGKRGPTWRCLCTKCGAICRKVGNEMRRGHTKNCSRKCAGIKRSKHIPWINATGYEWVYSPGHPNASASGQIAVHRKVMSEILGRPLDKDEEVHHKNGIRSDNRPENLELWKRGHQPKGARVSDLVDFATTILKQYAPERLNDIPQ